MSNYTIKGFTLVSPWFCLEECRTANEVNEMVISLVEHMREARSFFSGYEFARFTFRRNAERHAELWQIEMTITKDNKCYFQQAILADSELSRIFLTHLSNELSKNSKTSTITPCVNRIEVKDLQ